MDNPDGLAPPEVAAPPETRPVTGNDLKLEVVPDYERGRVVVGLGKIGYIALEPSQATQMAALLHQHASQIRKFAKSRKINSTKELP